MINLTGCYGMFKTNSQLSGDDEFVQRKLTKRLINQNVFLVSAGEIRAGDSVIDVARYETAMVTGSLTVTLRNASFTPDWPVNTTAHKTSTIRYAVAFKQADEDIYSLYRQLLTYPEVSSVEMLLDYTGGRGN
jgi:hypothetical protein